MIGVVSIFLEFFCCRFAIFPCHPSIQAASIHHQFCWFSLFFKKVLDFLLFPNLWMCLYESAAMLQVMHMFRGCRSEEMPPHIYAVAQRVHRAAHTTRGDQSIVLTGHSGSGKTSSLRHLLHYYSVMAGAGALTGSANIAKLNIYINIFQSYAFVYIFNFLYYKCSLQNWQWLKTA